MEVTKKNFDEALNMVQASIKKSDFLAIDAEFTGLRNGWTVCKFDLPKEYYYKTLNGSNDFLLIQFGICAFHWDHIREMYKNDAYTFYIFPSLISKKSLFLSDSSTLEFLVANGLDLNKLVLEGLGYVPEFVKKKSIPLPEEDKDTVEIWAKENDRELKEKQQEQNAQDELDAIRGFTKVATMIRESGKLVVGHNMLLDIIKTLATFYIRMPPDYSDFKTVARGIFPRLIDTKYMSSMPPFKERVNINSLPLLLSRLSEPPFSVPRVAADTGRGYTGEENVEHVAGYDAYVTGMCFLGMHKYLARVHGDVRMDLSSTVLEPFLDKLYLSRTADQGSPCMNLAGDESLPSRDHVFYVSYPQGWHREELKMAFKKYGEITEEFLGKNSAAIALSRKDLASMVERDFAGNKSVIVRSYDEHVKSIIARPDRERFVTNMKTKMPLRKKYINNRI